MLSPIEDLVSDGQQRLLPARPATHVALVLIDEEAIRQIGPWPWTRAQLAELVERVSRSKPKGIALDLLLPESREGDESLAAALAQTPTVLAVGMDEGGRLLTPDSRLQQAILGHVSFNLDRDGTVRRFPSTRQVGDRMLPAFALAAARLQNPELPIPLATTLHPAWRSRSIPCLSAAKVLADQGTTALQGRTVFIGASAAGIGDHWVTPATRRGSPDPGVVVEASCAEAILTGDLVRAIPPVITALLALILGWLGSLALERTPILLVPIALAPFLLASLALPLRGLEIPSVGLLISILLPGILAAILAARRTRHGLKEARKRIQALEALREAMPQGRDAEARRVLAHELKTPLTSMRGLAQLLSRFDLTPQERDRVAGLVVAESTRLAQMVDSLLDLERLAFRQFDREAVPVALSELIHERLDILRIGTDREWQSEVQPDVWVQGDRALLARVLENLVANALKFSPPGSPVRVALRASGAATVLEVEDHGPGVAEQERSAIFGRFNRGSAQSLAPGLGLGLALVAEVVNWHKGEVEVDAGKAGGSLFRVRLPLGSGR